MGMGGRIALGCYAQSLRCRSKLHSYGSRKDSALYCTIYEIYSLFCALNLANSEENHRALSYKRLVTSSLCRRWQVWDERAPFFGTNLTLAIAMFLEKCREALIGTFKLTAITVYPYVRFLISAETDYHP